MNTIVFPLKLRMQGAVVADLQDVLQLCLERSVLLPADDAARREMSEALKRERTVQTYDSVTAKLVSLFQDGRGLTASGEVDEPAAKAFNELLQQWGMFGAAAAVGVHVVSGEVRRQDGLLLQGVQIRAHHESERGAILLGENATDAQGRYTIRYELLPGVEGTNLRVSAVGDDGELLQSSEVTRNAKPLEIVDLTLAIDRKPAAQRRVEGQVMLQHGLPAAHLKLRLYRLDFGGTATLLNETTTLAGGHYAFAYDAAGKAASLQVRTVNATGGEIPLSRPLNDRSGESRAGLNLVAPGTLQPLAAEYGRLSADLTAHVGTMTTLAGARENNDRQDLTVLNRATGWDARLIALAATTERLSADADAQLPQEPLYGLLRAGLPSDKLTLAQVDPEVAEQALKAVRDAGIVELSDPQIADFKSKFAAFTTKVRLNIPAPGSRATYGQLLGSSGLSPEVQAKFAPVYLGHRGTGAELWEEARKAGLDGAQIGTLQLQGKLAFLAGNSEGMTRRLMQKGIDDPAELVEQDFHHAETWVEEVLAHVAIPSAHLGNLTDAEKQKLDAEVPARYVGEKVEDRLRAYAADMARKLDRSYPTPVVERLIEQNAIELPASRDETATLLKNAAVQGFRLGETSVDGFLNTHAGVHAGLTGAAFESARQQLKTLQRVYQITPSHDAMPVLLALQMTSAYDVTAYPEAEFTALFDAKYFELHGRDPASAEAGLVYRKACQVEIVTFNLFAIAGKVDNEPAVAGFSAPVAVREQVRDGLIKQFPTMESLFGSMDFCECEHCRSVLSPAAYFVDLMQFVDPEAREWDNFLARWKTSHGGSHYPHPKPYDVLMERRPDLPHIALTCENTHTALPYIDIVNEILEYYVANGKLEEQAARDTGEATTAELLAEPQNVISGAYEKLREARYPLALPFDLWTDTVREFCDHFETPLARVMEVFRPSDDLFAPAQAFDRSTIFMESLGLSPAEVAVFTNPDPLDTWHELYGFTTAAEATTEAVEGDTGQRIDLHSARALCRRLGITYQELVAIIQTGFVNPKIAQLGLLYKLGIGIHDARVYLDHLPLVTADPATLAADDQKLQLEVQALHEKLGPAQAAVQAIPFDAVLVLADPSAGGNFDLTTVRYANGGAADPLAFLRINLFVRLWRTLGWSIDETSRALEAFVPASAPFEEAHLGQQPLKTALIYLAHLKALEGQLNVGKQGRIKLLTLWTNLPTTGKQPLYAQLFLTRGMLKSDAVFDDPLGNYLSGAVPKLTDHIPALRGALGLTLDEVGRVLEDAGEQVDTADLSLPTVSRLYRYGLLAKGLRLSVRELISLKQLSGLDPFTPLHPDPLADTPASKAIELDRPFSQTLRFVEVAQDVKDSGLTIEDLEYLLRHRFDAAGKYRQDPEAMRALLKTMAEGIRAIRIDPTIPTDPPPASPDELRQRLIRQFVLQTITSYAGAEATLVERLLTDAAVLGGTVPLLQTVIGGAEAGLGAGFDEAERAVMLLTKVLQLAEALGLNERELRYLLTHGDSLSALPTRPGDDTVAGAMALFGTFLRLAAYARLDRELGDGPADLIDIFEASESTAPDVLDTKIVPLIARLTRRDEPTVKATARALAGPNAISAFASERPLRRLWLALQVVQRFGVPAASLLEWARVVVSAAPDAPRFEVARDVKEAIKARLDSQAWQRVAQPMFDRLRRRQRDALVAFVMHQRRFASMEQLYEHFLVDPGMEPVVQTSRIRLAIASLQLFIQRSLLNMEPKVHPSVVNAGQWEWMKRYRVWEANRKIFLFPENWLEPEFRDDKTHLFAELEGALLEGDISNDLAEDAFLNYLKTLDELARLDIVAMHMEDGEPAARTLHVIGRTYGKPHKHFYRRYARQMWTPWEPVSAEVEGDHLVPVVWRDRLYLFWVKFLDKPVREPQFGASSGNQALGQAKLSSIINDVSAAGRQKQLDVQLHWSECLAGEWSTSESSAFVPVTTVTVVPPHWERRRVGDTRPATAEGYVWVEATQTSGPLLVSSHFDVNSVFVHVSKEPYENGDECGVYIHLRGGGVNQAFYLAGRNAEPESAFCGEKPSNPLSSASRVMANRYGGSGALSVEFRRHITTEDGQAPVDTVQVSGVLQKCDAYTLLPCDSAATPLITPDLPDEDAAVQAAIERGLPEIAALMRPVFYQDNSHTFFVEPSVTERTIEEWQDWVTPTPQPDPGWHHPEWWRDLTVLAEIPRGPAPDPGDLGGSLGIAPESVIGPTLRADWLVNPATALEFDGVLIGPAGRPGLDIVAAGGQANAGSPVGVHPASGLASGSTLVLSGATSLERSGLTPTPGGLNVVGGGGFNAGLARNLDEATRTGLGARIAGIARLER
ncbi:MAG: hypothetical protein IPN92_15035 [Chromatiaceae bacterium]|nr:hypothetical protein [Chromatiaceae bacterium]